jgi:hypothetical protein
VIDLQGQRRIDSRQRLACRHAAGSGGENLAVIRLGRRFRDVVARQNLFAYFGDKSV